jgi:hypothetical protein
MWPVADVEQNSWRVAPLLAYAAAALGWCASFFQADEAMGRKRVAGIIVSLSVVRGWSPYWALEWANDENQLTIKAICAINTDWEACK